MSDLAGARPWRVGMRRRDADELHRGATPLELLFDLTFVVAVALAAGALAHDVVDNHVLDGLVGFLTVFFAIWWAWMNFTWFASAFDTDDTPYRLLTMLQMGGVLVLAAGVPAAFDDSNFATVTVGYLVMRVAMVLQWLRASRADPVLRTTCLRYAGGIALVQVGWLLRLGLPENLFLVSFLVLVAAEIAVPVMAEHAGRTSWHPHHVTERYGLFAIILLGESVLAATTSVQLSLTEDGLTPSLGAVSVAALLLLFGLWWLYFLRPAGAGLAAHRERSFTWGYGHYGLFAALAALGAGLEVAAEAVTGHATAPHVVVSLAVAVPVVVVLVLLDPLHAPLFDERTVPRPDALLAATTTLVLGSSPLLGVPDGAAVLLLALPTSALVAARVAAQHRAAIG